MAGAEERLKRFREILAEAHGMLRLAFGFELWDGSTVPADLAPDAMRIVIRRESVVSALVRRPGLDTLINAHVAGLLDLENGTIFELAAQRPQGKIGKQLKAVGLLKALRALAPFWRAPTELLRPPAGLRGDTIDRDGRPGTSKANVAYHYDVSNAFYRLFLDREMVYTCAYFQPDWHDDIDRAQRDKLDMICRKLRLAPGDRFLDIGCGWGALICHAAEHYGVRATGVTLAEEQAALARERIASRGLEGRVEVELKDYTQMEGEFDKISSIGMFEHVGIKNYPTYFRTVHRLLRPRGLYLHHTIARRAKRSERAFARLKPEYRALIRYIFPGGELDHLGMSVANLERFGFEVHDVEAWREHYQRTTRLWWERLAARRSEAEAEVGFEKTRMWLLYLAGCSLAFERAAVGVNQTLSSKRTRGSAGLPPSRADLYR
jgi:cyclopropane-fatty-acyl-phospholipid synthase